MQVTENTRFVGEKNPIELKVKNMDEVSPTIGEAINRGDHSIIYAKNDSEPKRVYKKIDLRKFENGDEVRITEIAGNVGVAPKFHDAFVLNEGTQQFVMIEMDHAGKSLGQIIQDKGVYDEEEEEATLEIFPRSTYSKYSVTEIKTKKTPPLSEIIKEIYDKSETFYFELFSRLKTLAENKIAYMDTHAWNIIPNRGSIEGMKLIDFDTAFLMDSVEEAKKDVLQGTFVSLCHLRIYRQLPDLSEESRTLLRWFDVDPDGNEKLGCIPS